MLIAGRHQNFFYQHHTAVISRWRLKTSWLTNFWAQPGTQNYLEDPGSTICVGHRKLELLNGKNLKFAKDQSSGSNFNSPKPWRVLETTFLLLLSFFLPFAY